VAKNYRAKARTCELAVAGTGNEQVVVLFDCLDEPGKTMIWFGSFADGAVEFTFQALRNCGWHGNDLRRLPDMGDGFGTLEVSLSCEEETYNGKTREKVNWVNKPGLGAAVKNKLEGAALQSFAAKMQGKLAAYNAKAGMPKNPAAQKPSEQVPTEYTADDYIPF
jgi:hypothetical protein